MTYHVHPSPNPHTLYSLYTTEKPENLNVATDEKLPSNAIINIEMNIWLASHLAYLQELEFKEWDKVNLFQDKTEFIVDLVNINSGILIVKKTKTFNDWAKLWKPVIGNEFLLEDCSHYYPGQEIKASKVSYVREVCKWKKYEVEPIWIKWNITKIRFLKLTNLREDIHVKKEELTTEWQPSPEPEKRIDDRNRETNWDFGCMPDAHKWELTQKTVNGEWQKCSECSHVRHIEPNPLHAQWLTDRSEGKVQAIINQT